LSDLTIPAVWSQAEKFACVVVGQGTSGSGGRMFKIRKFRYLFICQGTSTRRQRSDHCGLRVNLPPVTTSL